MRGEKREYGVRERYKGTKAEPEDVRGDKGGDEQRREREENKRTGKSERKEDANVKPKRNKAAWKKVNAGRKDEHRDDIWRERKIEMGEKQRKKRKRGGRLAQT